jgi:hypothetical protein
MKRKIAQTSLQGDVIWYILMGPENYRLDFFKGYEDVPLKIIYFFDTLPHQYKLISKLNLDEVFSIRITSFIEAVEYLEKSTMSKWHYIPQASIEPRVIPTINSKSISFCSYGRGNDRLNAIIKQFCYDNNLYFDYTQEGQGELKTNNIELYQNYIWHTSQSIFNICFSVESTNPTRAGNLSPITCRWFEAILSRNIVIGISPKGKDFKELFPDGFVQSIDMNSTDNDIYRHIEGLWINREEIFSRVYNDLTDRSFEKYKWESRVMEICNLLPVCAV